MDRRDRSRYVIIAKFERHLFQSSDLMLSESLARFNKGLAVLLMSSPDPLIKD